jgi:hypothetical protein
MVAREFIALTNAERILVGSRVGRGEHLIVDTLESASVFIAERVMMPKRLKGARSE